MLIFPRKRHFQTLLAQLIRRQNSVTWMHALWNTSLDLSLPLTRMNHPFIFIKSRAWLYFVHWSLWMFTVDEMRMKTAFTPFTLDESSAMYIQSVKCKFALTLRNIVGWVVRRAGLDGCGKLSPMGIESPERPTHRYRLHYPGLHEQSTWTQLDVCSEILYCVVRAYDTVKCSITVQVFTALRIPKS
jgi:hypothetical protein